MPSKPQTRVITTHPALGRLDPATVASGPVIPPRLRVLLFSPSEWEQFINEWASSLPDYEQVERTGGAGDQGCDVVGLPELRTPTMWDNYQCKHYDHALMPSDIWVELGKVCFYSYRQDYSFPRRYKFVAPHDVGTSLAKLLRKPDELKRQLFTNWERHCRRKITTMQEVELDGALRSYIEALNFSVFGYKPLLQVIEDHKKTAHYVARFGLGLPQRPVNGLPPVLPQAAEARYVEQLLEAYGDNAGTAFTSHSGLPGNYDRHFKRARESFYAAESLRNFSRDTLPEGTFEHLKEQVHKGVVDVCEDEHACGFTRLKATTREAARLQITSSPLIGKTDVTDLQGICHQLANDDELIWVPKSEGGELG